MKIKDEMLPKEGGDYPDNLTVAEVLEAKGDFKATIDEVREVEVTDYNDNTKKVQKLAIELNLGGDERRTYWPNKTSIANLVDILGDETDAWKGNEITLTSAKVKVKGKGMKDAIFVPEKGG